MRWSSPSTLRSAFTDARVDDEPGGAVVEREDDRCCGVVIARREVMPVGELAREVREEAASGALDRDVDALPDEFEEGGERVVERHVTYHDGPPSRRSRSS
jgi:hypothetical protein